MEENESLVQPTGFHRAPSVLGPCRRRRRCRGAGTLDFTRSLKKKYRRFHRRALSLWAECLESMTRCCTVLKEKESELSCVAQAQLAPPTSRRDALPDLFASDVYLHFLLLRPELIAGTVWKDV